MGSIVWSERAQVDLAAIYGFVAADSPVVALRLVLKLRESVSRLEEFPDSGRAIQSPKLLDVREIVVKPYRIAYKNLGDTVYILKVHHASRLLHLTDLEETL